jgi:hypothetical protein
VIASLSMVEISAKVRKAKVKDGGGGWERNGERV